MGVRMSRLVIWASCVALAWCSPVSAEPTQVRLVEGPAQGSLVLTNLTGNVLANGDLVQTVSGSQVTVRVTFQFADGSLHDETAMFSQDGVFRLLSYHLVQNGPSFRWSLDMTMKTQEGRVVIRHKAKDGDEDIEDVTLTLAADVSNGIMPTVLKNLSKTMVPAAASFVAATPEPRPVKLAISAAGSENVSIAGSARPATHYVVKAEIGGLAGVLAPLVGKQPPDTHVWIFEGASPTFAKSEGPLFYGGPIWRIELTRLVSP